MTAYRSTYYTDPSKYGLRLVLESLLNANNLLDITWCGRQSWDKGPVLYSYILESLFYIIHFSVHNPKEKQ